MAAISHTVIFSWNGTNGGNLSNTVPITGSTEINISEQITATTTNQAVSYAIAHSSLQEFFVVTDQNLTMYVNAPGTGSPILTVTLEAGVPYIWLAASGVPNPFSADITGLWFTNSGSTAANLNVRSLRS